MMADQPEDRRLLPTWVLAAGCAAMAATFLVDLLLPLDLAGAVPYVVPVLLGLWAPRSRYALVMTVVASVLTIGEPLLTSHGGTWSHVAINRAFSLAGIWAACLLVLSHSRLQVENAARRERETRTLAELEDFKSAIDQSSIVAITDSRGRITHANDKFCEISGYAREELIGQDHRILNSGLHPKEFFHELWRTISSGRPWRGEIRNRAKDGHHYWVDTTIIPFLDASGRPFRYVAIRNDITARKVAQEALLNQAALARLGEMAAVVAHEVKNPLAGIAGVLQILRTRFADGSEDHAIVGETLERIDALNVMVEDLLLFARPRPLKAQPIPLVALVAETVRLLERDPQWGRVSVRVTGDEPTVRADAEQLRGALLNLVLNAAQAMGGEGVIEINVTADGDLAKVGIRDHGPGIPEDSLERVFEPFVTTKSRGTGLGLALARRVVEAHGGRLIARMAPGGGALLELELPLAASLGG